LVINVLYNCVLQDDGPAMSLNM